MSELSKITADHRRRCAFVYVRQSSTSQVEHNRESTQRQYRLVERAVELGWQRDQINVVDEDLGLSGSGVVERSGFARMTAQVALGQVGLVLGLEVSRLARNNADWYRLLDLCGVTDTLIGDADGIYHPGLFNDRLVLGLKGTMSEAELHVLRARLDGGIRNKAARGELRRGLPVGFVWGDEDGEVRFDPDEAITGAVRTVFVRFAEMGSARQVWLWFRSQALRFPLRKHQAAETQWGTPTYTRIHQVLTSPVYAGAYVYGRTRQERHVDSLGQVRKRLRRLPRSQWSIVIRDHHPGFITWDAFEANVKRLDSNTHPRPHEAGGAVREGAALLQGIATCGRCGRGLHIDYGGRSSSPAYYCPGSILVGGRGEHCLRVGGGQIDQAVSRAFLATVAPAGLEASLETVAQLEGDHDAALAQWRRQVEQARYEAQRAERRYRAVDPDNRLVARGLETEWEKCLHVLEAAQRELSSRERQRPRSLSAEERQRVLSLGADLNHVWPAPTTTDRDRKELLHTLLEEVVIAVDRERLNAHLVLRWRGGLLSELDVVLFHPKPSPIRTGEETLGLVRRLAEHYPDAVIAGILNRQGRKTATGLPFTISRVSSLRTHWKIACFEPRTAPSEGELLTVNEVAKRLGLAPSTIFRWLNDGFIPGEQLTPGAPWRIRMTEELRSRFVDVVPEGFVAMQDATRILGISRQTVLQRVKRGELEAAHVRTGRRKGLKIKALNTPTSLFDHDPADGRVV